ncbi:MAG TPA: hypothetical protein GXX77_04105 [Candidatus Cloacimonetes bacterium]|nr:hypothetical protein [Candidatus Cloacimonadota bacterium]
MIYKGRQLIASKYNASGKRVFIPLAMRIGGKDYVIPFRLKRAGVQVRDLASYSPGTECVVRLDIATEDVVYTEPFVLDGVN